MISEQVHFEYQGRAAGNRRRPAAVTIGQVRRTHDTACCLRRACICTASVQQGTTSESLNVDGRPRLIELSNTEPSVSVPS